AQSQSGDPLDAAVRVPRIAIGSLVLIGEDHPAPDLADFPAKVAGDGEKVEANWIAGSVKWVRTGDGLALPRARLRVVVHAAPERALLRWRGRAVSLQEGPDGAFAELFVPLLEGGDARVELDGRPAARVTIAAKPVLTGSPAVRHAIDHSCSPWNVSIKGLDDAYLSLSCRMTPVGRVGTEEALLEVHWTAAGVTLPDGSAEPMGAQLRDGRPARVTVIGPDGKPRVVELAAFVPARLHRMRLAWGAGPYHLSSSAASGNGPALSATLYGNFRLRTAEDGLSIRAFEAAVSQSPTNTSFFNNLGLYFAYDLKRVWDTRLHLTALLGMQTVTFAPQGLARRSYSTALAPQGFEISYPDAFGRKNETLSGGLFLQPTAATPYQNFWLRYGKRWFGEINYISWRSNDRYARMSGVSVGAPFASLF
ncbi:MAG: hypothetical protein ACHQ2Z_13835, partial [Elusimicrobiota bacterium]